MQACMAGLVWWTLVIRGLQRVIGRQVGARDQTGGEHHFQLQLILLCVTRFLFKDGSLRGGRRGKRRQKGWLAGMFDYKVSERKQIVPVAGRRYSERMQKWSKMCPQRPCLCLREKSWKEHKMKTACVIPVFLSWALGSSERSFPTVYKFHTGEWPFDIDFPTPSLQPR